MSSGSDPSRADAAIPAVLPSEATSTFAGKIWAKAAGNPSAMIIANTAAQSVLRLGSNIILARLLSPSAFALMAITTLIMSGIQMVTDVGIAITALREGEMSRENEDRLWTMQLVRGLGVGLVMIAAAAPVGWLYGDVRLRDVLFALALMPALSGAQSLYPVLALAHRRLLPSTLLEVVGRVGGMVLSILVALVSPTVWSLVIGTLTGIVIATLGSHFMAARMPRFVFDLDYIRNQWRFARWIQASSTLTFVGGQIDKAIFPFLFGMSGLGIYGIGSTFAAMPSQVTQRWSASVFYPLTVQLLHGDTAARAKLLSLRTTMLLYTAIVTLAVMAVAPSFFLLLYPARYHEAAGLAAILAIGVFFELAESSLRHMPLVEGVAHYEVTAVLVRMTTFFAGVLIVWVTGAGVAGYALSFVAGLVGSYLFMLSVDVRRGYLGLGFDLVLISVLIGAAVLVWLLPLERVGSLGLIVEGVVVVATASVVILLVYWRRGFPSLPAEPAPEVLRETAKEEIEFKPEPI